MALITTLGIFLSAGTSVYAAEQIKNSEVDTVAQGLEQMFSNGVSEENFKNYVNANFSSEEITGIRILWWKRAYKLLFSNFLISVEKSTP